MATTSAKRRSVDSQCSDSPHSSAHTTANPTPPLQCNCGRTFTRVENLRRHQRSHEDSRRLACSICGRTFNRPDVLRRHMRTHRGPSLPGRSGDSPPRTAQSSVPSLSESGRQNSSESSSRENELAPANFSPRRDDRRPDRPHRGDLPSIDSLLPGHNAFEPNHAMSRVPPSFPIGGLPLPHLQRGATINRDHDRLWILQDTALDVPWRDFARLEASLPASTDIPAPGFSFYEALNPLPAAFSGGRGPRFPSASGTLGRLQHSDTWATGSTTPKRPYVPGAEGTIEEVAIDPATDPKLWPWSRFWLDDSLYASVKISLKWAQEMPGLNLSGFHMPESLHTVNSLISNYFNAFYPQLPILHLPTFSVAKAHPLLVAAIICIGASTSPIPGARPFAVDLIEIIRRTIGTLFEMDPLNVQTLDHIHVCLLNCVAGISIGHQRSFQLAEVSRGLLVQLCRNFHLLKSPFNGPQLASSLPSNPTDRWYVWIDMETRKRLGLGIFLLDAMFPSYMDMPSHLTQGEMLSTVLPCAERFWRASSPEEWNSLVGHSVLPPWSYFVTGVSALVMPRGARNTPPPVRNLDHFGSLCLMNALHHHIWEYRSQLLVYQSIDVVSSLGRPDDDYPPDLAHGFEGRRRWLEDALDTWRDWYYHPGDYTPLSVSGKILYHLGHISLRIHIRDLYAVAKRSGVSTRNSINSVLKSWVRSPDAPVAAEHALRLLLAVGFPRVSDNRLAPPTVFLAVIILWGFWKHHGAALHPFDVAETARIFGTNPSSYAILKGGMIYMVNNKTWKLCSALALSLADMVDKDEAPSPSSHSPRSTRSI